MFVWIFLVENLLLEDESLWPLYEELWVCEMHKPAQM